MPKKILIADDDPHIREVVIFALQKAGMTAVEAKNGEEVLAIYAKEEPALIILDIGMPEMDGLEVCRILRKTSQVPILFLSSRDEEIDRVLGLELGGDDYVTKPFSPRELVARVNAILKRLQNGKEPTFPASNILAYGAITMEPDKHAVRWNNQPLQFTFTEFSILKGFLQQPERVFNRNAIIDMAYGVNIHISDRTIDSHIRHIRHKFQQAGGNLVIETVHGVGYKLGICE